MARISKEKKQQIKSKILTVSSKLFKELGYDETTTKRIAKEVGIAEGTIFNYFSTKEEILFESMYLDGSLFNFAIQSSYQKEKVVEELYSIINKTLNLAFRMPKGMGKGIISSMLKLAKKKPETLKRMVELDMKLLQNIELYLTDLINKEVLKKTDPILLSEILFGVVAYDIGIYFYSKEVTRKKVQDNIKNKLHIILDNYL